MLKKYEIIVIFDPDLDDNGLKSQLERIEAIVAGHNGTIEKKDVWGRRPLGYPIRKKEYGIYTMFIASGDNALVADLRRQLRITDAVLRSFVAKKDKYAPDLTQSQTPEPAVEKFPLSQKRSADFSEDVPDEAGV